MVHNISINIKQTPFFSFESACGMIKEFKTEKTRSLWKKLHFKKCVACGNTPVYITPNITNITKCRRS